MIDLVQMSLCTLMYFSGGFGLSSDFTSPLVPELKNVFDLDSTQEIADFILAQTDLQLLEKIG